MNEFFLELSKFWFFFEIADFWWFSKFGIFEISRKKLPNSLKYFRTFRNSVFFEIMNRFHLSVGHKVALFTPVDFRTTWRVVPHGFLNWRRLTVIGVYVEIFDVTFEATFCTRGVVAVRTAMLKVRVHVRVEMKLRRPWKIQIEITHEYSVIDSV